MPSTTLARAAAGTLALSLLLCGSLGAEQADRGKPMHIEADRLRFDELKQVRVITGNVVITKGSIVIRGARVEMREDPAGYQFAVVTGDSARRAFFRQKREGVDEFIEGEAESIEYDGRSESVKFAKRAEMRRLRGATLFDQMNGNLITYNNRSEVFSVDGQDSPAGAAAGDGSGGRIRIMLTPAPEASKADGQPASTPASGPALQSSPTLRRETR